MNAIAGVGSTPASDDVAAGVPDPLDERVLEPLARRPGVATDDERRRAARRGGRGPRPPRARAPSRGRGEIDAGDAAHAVGTEEPRHRPVTVAAPAAGVVARPHVPPVSCEDSTHGTRARLVGNDAVQAELIRGRLEVEGIPVLHKGDGEGPYRAGAVHVWVRAEDETTARAIIDAVMSGAFELPEGELPPDLPAEDLPMEDLPAEDAGQVG